MAHQGTELGVDLYELEKAAKDYLPTVSAVYADATAKCANAIDGLDNALQRPANFGSSFGPARGPYLQLHNIVTGFLKSTMSSLDDTATALDRAAQQYAANDDAAATEFQRRIQLDPPMPEK